MLISDLYSTNDVDLERETILQLHSISSQNPVSSSGASSVAAAETFAEARARDAETERTMVHDVPAELDLQKAKAESAK